MGEQVHTTIFHPQRKKSIKEAISAICFTFKRKRISVSGLSKKGPLERGHFYRKKYEITEKCFSRTLIIFKSSIQRHTTRPNSCLKFPTSLLSRFTLDIPILLVDFRIDINNKDFFFKFHMTLLFFFPQNMQVLPI